MFLALLKGFGWFMLAYVLALGIVIAFYYVFMNLFGYRWSVISAREYLSQHGRGYRQEENRYAIGVDIMTRLLCVLCFSIIGAIFGFIFLPSWVLKSGMLFGMFCFTILAAWIEIHFTIQIGKLSSIDTNSNVAYFENLCDIGKDVFSYCVSDSEGLERLFEGKKYIVVDFVYFKMFGPIDDYEWGDVDWQKL